MAIIFLIKAPECEKVKVAEKPQKILNFGHLLFQFTALNV
jgi:hypothetical protein